MRYCHGRQTNACLIRTLILAHGGASCQCVPHPHAYLGSWRSLLPMRASSARLSWLMAEPPANACLIRTLILAHGGASCQCVPHPHAYLGSWRSLLPMRASSARLSWLMAEPPANACLTRTLISAHGGAPPGFTPVQN